MSNRRLAAALGHLDSWGLPALLVTSLVNVRYLTGLDASNAALVLGAAPTLVTDDRYATSARARVTDLAVVIDREVAGAGIRAAAASGIRELGFEADHLSVTAWRECEQIAADVGVHLIPAPDHVRSLRAVKDAEEIGLLQQACAMTERALSRLFLEIAVGRTEQWVAARLDTLMREEGAEASAFDTIVAAGPWSAEPHHQPTTSVINRGDLVVIDCGARYAGYHADMTRTVVVGAPPETWQQEIFQIVGTAAAAGRDALRPGREFRDIDAAARSMIAEAGYDEFFRHGLGHGIGLEIHEAPMLGPRSPAGTLAEHMTVTIEPGVYLPGRGGVRIEDSLVVTSDGAESLTTMTRELLVLG